MSEPLETRSAWKDIRAALETLPIQSVASLFRVSAGEIAAAVRRTEMQRQAVIPREHRDDVVTVDADLSRDESPARSAAPMAASTRRPPPPRVSKIEAVRHLVGVEPDGVVAKAAGVGREAVQAYRQRHGIAPATRGPAASVAVAPATRAPSAPRGSKIDAFRHLVGVELDSVVAKAAGVGRNAVQMYRQQHGIAPATRGLTAPQPTVARPEPTSATPPEPDSVLARQLGVSAASVPAPVPPSLAVQPQPGRQLQAFHVVVRDGEAETTYVAVGADIAEAAARAVAAGKPGAILSLTWFSEAL